jgi:hypothetical protein
MQIFSLIKLARAGFEKKKEKKISQRCSPYNTNLKGNLVWMKRAEELSPAH